MVNKKALLVSAFALVVHFLVWLETAGFWMSAGTSVLYALLVYWVYSKSMKGK